MVYINADGTITENAPFSLTRIFGFFWGILNFFYMFMWTLFNPGRNPRDSRYTVNFRPPGSQRPPSNDRFRSLGSSGGPDAPPASGGCGCGG